MERSSGSDAETAGRRRSAVERRLERGGATRPPVPVRAEMLRRQRGLAERVTSYLRDQNPTYGLTVGALLLVAAGGALVYDLAFEQTEQVPLAPVQPLAAEVKEGLPTKPGRYNVDPESVTRDARGVYRFGWYDPAVIGGAPQPAAVSLLKLAPDEERDEIDIPAQGDPTLYLRQSTPIGIIAETAQTATATTTPTASTTSSTRTSSGVRGPGFVYLSTWYPYDGGTYTRTPAYRQPPIDGQVTSAVYRGTVDSPAPRAPAQRTVSVPGRADAVSGQASGTGAGTAVTSKSGLGVSKTSISSSRSTGFSSGVGSSSSSSSAS
jgi:hypothetical protein